MPENAPSKNVYHSCLVSAAIWTMVIAVLSALMTDGGETCRLSVLAMLIFWGMVAVVRYRRHANLTYGDLALIRWGCPTLVVAFNVCTHIVWRLRGLT